MPLAFDSSSHGRIAFGFFNIDSDMLLLERYFIFASEFCRAIVEIAGSPPTGAIQTSWDIWIIDPPGRIGDLMGAIHGIRHTGFLGEIYKRYPFPARPEDFKQNPEGHQTQSVVRDIIALYAHQSRIGVCSDASQSTISIGDYSFSRRVFNELLNYVGRGGYPQWRDNTPPEYVRAMQAAVSASRQPLFDTDRVSGKASTTGKKKE